jgi:hypothetical protein
MKRHGPPFASEPGSEAVSRVAERRSQYSTELGRARSPTPSPQNASTRRAAAQLRVVIAPTAAEKMPAGTVVLMARPGTGEWALRGRLGAVAASLRNGETVSLCAKYGVPLRFSGMAATTPVGG